MKRFFDKIEKTENGCWLWLAAKRGKSGYGCIKVNGKTIDSHRMSYIIHNGEIPNKLFVCHTCDVRLCVNPQHLFLGSHSINMKDAYNKGRLVVPTGVRYSNGNVPLNRTLTTVALVKHVTDCVKNRTTSLVKLSKELNLPYQLLRDISCGRVYKNI